MRDMLSFNGPLFCMALQEQEECIRETRVLSSLDSDYIIKYYDSFLERVRSPLAYFHRTGVVTKAVYISRAGQALHHH